VSDSLCIVTWRWGSKYGGHYVERLKAALIRNVKQEFRFGVFAPEAEDDYLTKVPGCFCRLRMFDPEWQEKHGLTGRIVCIDLDAVVTGPLDPLFDGKEGEDFTILQGVNAANPCPFNGSLWMLRAGTNCDVWSDFNLEDAARVAHYEFPDDQAWLHSYLPHAAAWGPADGVYAFQKPGWPKGEALPANARFVAFPGWRDPSKFTHLEWVRRHWQ
jgi:hypothetical protein